MSLPVVADSLQNYMAQINRFPLLSRREELSLSVRVKKDNDLEAAHKLITSNLRFVVSIAFEYRRYISSGIRLSDLIQEGNIGLMEAVKRFDPYKGFRLITYAVWWIRAHIQSFIIRSLSIVKKSSHRIKRRLSQQLNRVKEAIPVESLVMWHPEGSMIPGEATHYDSDLNTTDISLDSKIGKEGLNTLLDHLPGPSVDHEIVLSSREEKKLVKEKIGIALSSLSSRERYVIEQRILMDKPLTLQKIGDSLGITRERVRQIEKGAIKKLKETLC